MRLLDSARTSSPLQLAAIAFVSIMPLATVFAIERDETSLGLKDAMVTLEEHPQQEWILPNGKTLKRVTTTATLIDPTDQRAIEAAEHHHQEIKDLISQKKYEQVKTFRNESTGGTEYVYRFTLADGTQQNMNFSLPLDDIASWDEYQRKAQEKSEHDRQQINAAIAANKYRLINQDVILIHSCRNPISGRKFQVERIPLHKGDPIALYLPEGVAPKEATKTQLRSTWPEHLQAIRTGKLELLDARTIFTYQYEVTCEDGVKRIFQYGGDELLQPSKAN